MSRARCSMRWQCPMRGPQSSSTAQCRVPPRSWNWIGMAVWQKNLPGWRQLGNRLCSYQCRRAFGQRPGCLRWTARKRRPSSVCIFPMQAACWNGRRSGCLQGIRRIGPVSQKRAFCSICPSLPNWSAALLTAERRCGICTPPPVHPASPGTCRRSARGREASSLCPASQVTGGTSPLWLSAGRTGGLDHPTKVVLQRKPANGGLRRPIVPGLQHQL